MHYKEKVPARVTQVIQQHTIINPDTCKPTPQTAYRAVIEFVRKPPEERTILCSSLEDVSPDDTVFVSFHTGMRQYQHNSYTTVSDCQHCHGGFYFLNGENAE